MAAAASFREEERRPAALLPAWAARLAGFVPLALVGALEWKRMVAGVGAGRALSWVLVAALAGLLVVACDRLPRRLWSAGVLGTAAVGLLAAFAVSGLDLGLLWPSRWVELGDGLARGAEALGGVRLPYDAADPWPGLTLQLAGAVLCMLAALLTFWPRAGGRGYQFLALIGLLVLVASPVVSIGGTRSLVLGAGLAALTVCFLWLERLPLRPGLGVAVLLAVALAGALPLATVADRGEPWFDYRAFAEGLGPQDPIRFDWNHEYGPITWPRNGSEVMRVDSRDPHYWKVRDLEDFDGTVWQARGAGQRTGADPVEDLAPDWSNRPNWTESFRVTIRRMRTSNIVGAGTVIGVSDSTRPVRRGGTPGAWVADSELRRGDSYSVRVHAPRPTGSQMAGSTAGKYGRQGQDLVLDVPFRRRVSGVPRAPRGTPVRGARLVFPPFQEEDAKPFAEYPTVQRHGSAEFALRRSKYARTWRLAKRLRAQADTPFEYIVAVDRYLKGPAFGYSEVPATPKPDQAPLDAFLFDSKRGYCQHYSGAMVLLLRMSGIPARVATGFSPGGYSERRKAWIVRDTDAHSWVEAWLDAYGWVTFDPTPAATPARSQIAALEEPAPRADSSSGDAAADAAGGGQTGGRPSLRADLLRDPQRGDDGEEQGAAGDGGPSWLLFAAGFAVLALLGGGLVRMRRRPARAGATALDRAIAELEAALRRAGRPAPPSETLSQVERRLDLRGDAAAYVRALRSGRYAPAAPLPTRAQRRALRRELAEGLGFSGWVRALWALPPWARRG